MPAIISEHRVRNKPTIKVWPQNKHTNCFLTPSLFLKLWFGITFLIRYFSAKINLFVLGKQIYLIKSFLSRIKPRRPGSLLVLEFPYGKKNKGKVKDKAELKTRLASQPLGKLKSIHLYIVERLSFYELWFLICDALEINPTNCIILMVNCFSFLAISGSAQGPLLVVLWACGGRDQTWVSLMPDKCLVLSLTPV